MKIPFSKPVYYGKEVENVLDAVESTWLSDGRYIRQFEESLEDILMAKHVLATSNGTSALHLAFLALEIEPGDEVIVPAFGFEAASNVLKLMGAKPVYADVDKRTWVLTPQSIWDKISYKTRAVVIIHNYGNLSDVEIIKQVCRIPTIEDCAESLFSKYGDSYCGTIGTIGTFSFHATKTITTGEGGAVCTNTDILQEWMSLYRSHGLRTRGTYDHEVNGHNFRMSNILAALGSAQLDNWDLVVERKTKIFTEYNNCFYQERGITPQHFDVEVEPVIWSYAVRLDPEFFPQGRDKVIEDLKLKGIETRPGFRASARLPVATDLANNVIVLPAFSSLSVDNIHTICSSLLQQRRK